MIDVRRGTVWAALAAALYGGEIRFAEGASTQGESRPVPARSQSARSGAVAPGRERPARSRQAGERISGRSLDAAFLEQLVFDCVNEERMRHRLRPFVFEASLHRVARTHSSDMAARGYFSHDTRRGLMRNTGFGDRLRGSGVTAASLAENIAMLPLVRSRRMTVRTDGYGRRTTEVEEARLSYGELARWAVQQWMESPGHRKNILNPTLTTMGIGVALGKKDSEDYVYLTQDFGGR